MADAHGLRARDSDRVDACALLDAARESGELTADEHAGRTAKAMAAKTFGELDAVLSDLQIPRNLFNAPVVRPSRRGPSTRWRVAAAIMVAAALLGAFAGCVSRTAAPKPELPDPTTGPGLASFVAAYQDHFGDTEADQVLLYPEYVLIERRRDPASSRDAYIRYDGAFHDNSDTPRSPGTDIFDLAALDIPKLAALFAGAPRSAGVPDGRISHIEIARGGDGSPVVTVHVDDGSRSGHFVVTAKGEPMEIVPPS
ncbi:DUF1707 SHOCT-like domain-containing protein [Nocardia seriolae]|uniref:DUF1707 domain-containing protein n=1 Tax=Nocardia seriolae TaxID=37332 RepID=A0ABC9YZ67_9NOCA|nr:DUF1707 domain-containing protein [Nocardia seriolae]APA95178.1 uncharacterized protein NS506_01105 [Nocardia seriolae]OJF83191.1 hypothetical protein NS14008_33835 [Nocardia seriolae]QOW31937.1 DUF1707 domain-containing protein [Nocardia seriolae]QUN19544.1 DUF1707 domain-containing protein [Nocardia seriolae]WKY52924.1 DUF1707 domain-containing protein [Nocardia seriolae]